MSSTPEQIFAAASQLLSNPNDKEAIKEAVKRLREAALKGHPGAQFNLGLLHARGMGTPIDVSQASYWLTMAATQGHAKAQNALLRMRHTAPLGSSSTQPLEENIEQPQGIHVANAPAPHVEPPTDAALLLHEVGKKFDHLGMWFFLAIFLLLAWANMSFVKWGAFGVALGCAYAILKRDFPVLPKLVIGAVLGSIAINLMFFENDDLDYCNNEVGNPALRSQVLGAGPKEWVQSCVEIRQDLRKQGYR